MERDRIVTQAYCDAHGARREAEGAQTAALHAHRLAVEAMRQSGVYCEDVLNALSQYATACGEAKQTALDNEFSQVRRDASPVPTTKVRTTLADLAALSKPAA